jgi:hypothetical protein
VTDTTISPFIVGEITQVELADDKGEKKKYWKKEILPSGVRNYKGTKLDFSKINPAVLDAFNDNAVDQVPLVLALADNKHPETGQELERLEGDLTKLEMSKEGSLFGFFDLSDDVVNKIRKSNKKLGVSARIDIDYKREDTEKNYPYALRHVCATTAAHIKGMKPWETVELTDEEKSGNVLDLSTEVVDSPTTKETGDDLVTVNISKDQLDKITAFMAEVEKAQEIGNDLNKPAEDDGVKLSEAATTRIELAEKAAKDALALAEQGQSEAAAARWESRKRDLALAGVPPVMLTKAEPIMKLAKPPSINLSEGETLSASEVIGAILDEAKGTIKFSEEGHSFSDGSDSSNLSDEEKKFAESFAATFDNF